MNKLYHFDVVMTFTTEWEHDKKKWTVCDIYDNVMSAFLLKWLSYSLTNFFYFLSFLTPSLSGLFICVWVDSKQAANAIISFK